jgi:hypothetical protein
VFFKNHYLEILYLMKNIIKLNKHLVVFLMMIIFNNGKICKISNVLNDILYCCNM